MAVCEICGKGRQFGHNVSHSKRRTNRSWRPNIQKVTTLIDGRAGAATLAVPESDPERARDPNVVKVVLDTEGCALYFSRAAIPASHPGASEGGGWLRHVGVYAIVNKIYGQARGLLSRAA